MKRPTTRGRAINLLKDCNEVERDALCELRNTIMIPTNRPFKIFLCHGSEDKIVIRELYRRLKNDGAQPWLDEEDILPGQEWEKEIEKAVRSSDVILVCISRSSVNKSSFLQKEIKFALDVAEEKPAGTIFVIPTRLDASEAPECLRRWQWVDLFEGRGYEKLLAGLQARARECGLMLRP
jgi:hypothetical protein